MIVADGDGAVVIPAALVDDVVAAAVEQERLEGWIMREVEAGVRAARPLSGQRGDQGALRRLGAAQADRKA